MSTLTQTFLGSWTEVCHLDQLVAERGAAALVGDAQVALFKIDIGGGEIVVFAVDNWDPISHANVLARGIVGRGSDAEDDGTWYIASPLHKERYDLRTGECLSVNGVRIRTWDTAVIDGVVSIGDARHAASA